MGGGGGVTFVKANKSLQLNSPKIGVREQRAKNVRKRCAGLIDAQSLNLTWH